MCEIRKSFQELCNTFPFYMYHICQLKYLQFKKIKL